jgi:hypothetical protein
MTTTKKSNDFTGRQAAELADKAAKERDSRAEEMAMMTAQQNKDFEETIQDMTESPNSPTVIDEVLEVGVVLSDNSVVIRMAETVENMTYGTGNTYSFKAGGKYKVPRPVAARLKDLGLLYERL